MNDSVIWLVGSQYEPTASGSTAEFSLPLIDFNGVAIPLGELDAATLSLVDTASGDIVNAVNAVNILNTDRGVIDANGNLTITLGQGANKPDTVSLGPVLSTRSMVIDWTYNVDFFGRQQINFQIFLPVGP